MWLGIFAVIVAVSYALIKFLTNAHMRRLVDRRGQLNLEAQKGRGRISASRENSRSRGHSSAQSNRSSMSPAASKKRYMTACGLSSRTRVWQNCAVVFRDTPCPSQGE